MFAQEVSMDYVRTAKNVGLFIFLSQPSVFGIGLDSQKITLTNAEVPINF